jgi:hypothetical protein
MKRLLPLALLLGCFASHAAAFENPRQAQGYLHSNWSTVHTDSSNSDHVPLAMTPNVRQRWHLLKGAGIWTPPVVGTDGTVYAVTGKGPGHSHLHAISPKGEILWQSAPQQSPADLDSLAVFSAPVLDEGGDIYIGDGNQFWAFHPDGEVKWVTDLPGLGINGGFVTGMIVNDHVGGVSLDGKVMLLRRSNGELAMPVLDLPGADSPLGPPIPDALWKNLVDPAIRDQVWEILRGHRYEITNTPAVHPRTGRIYVIGAGKDESEGHFYGIDVTPTAARRSGPRTSTVRMPLPRLDRTTPSTSSVVSAWWRSRVTAARSSGSATTTTSLDSTYQSYGRDLGCWSKANRLVTSTASPLSRPT